MLSDSFNFTVKSGQGDYEVNFSQAAESIAKPLAEVSNSLFVIDRNVYALHAIDIDRLKQDRPFYLVDATEDEKSLPGCLKLLTWMQNQNATKASVLVVLGGGITQDIACFCAHNFYRGIRWIFCPTTLLSMADSCIGAKSAINLNQFKNQLGAFHSPWRVYICTEFLTTLSDQDMASGYGEIVKLFLTGGSWNDFITFSEFIGKEGLRNERLVEFLQKSLLVKKAIIERDEYEKDERRILNYGHTFGHALESVVHHEIPHGLAVLWGIDLVNYLAARRGILSEDKYKIIRKFVQSSFPFSLTQKVSGDDLLATSRRDKKIQGKILNLIFLTDRNSLQITPCTYDDELMTDVKYYVENLNIYAQPKQ